MNINRIFFSLILFPLLAFAPEERVHVVYNNFQQMDAVLESKIRGDLSHIGISEKEQKVLLCEGKNAQFFSRFYTSASKFEQKMTGDVTLYQKSISVDLKIKEFSEAEIIKDLPKLDLPQEIQLNFPTEISFGSNVFLKKEESVFMLHLIAAYLIATCWKVSQR